MAPRSNGVAEVVAEDGDSHFLTQVIERAQRGDVEAFEVLYRAHVSAIHALCLRMSGNRNDAIELVQDVFVHAWEKLPGFRGQSTLGTWLHRLAVNVVLENWRSAKRESLRMIDDPGELAMDASARDVDLDTTMDIDDAMAKLPAGARTVFVLHEIEGYSHEEIAAMTGIAAGTSRTQLFRARRALATLLNQ